MGGFSSDMHMGAGGLIGYTKSSVFDSHSSGDVSGDWNTGGLIGADDNDYEVIVEGCSASGNVTGERIVGGLVGLKERGLVSNSYSTGSVRGDSIVGGLI